RARTVIKRATTFAECANAYIDTHAAANKPAWRTLWTQTLSDHVYPSIGAQAVSSIDTQAVLNTLRLLWEKKPIAADRVRNRIKAVLDYAAVAGYRSPGDNPARWSGHLSN